MGVSPPSGLRALSGVCSGGAAFASAALSGALSSSLSFTFVGSPSTAVKSVSQATRGRQARRWKGFRPSVPALSFASV
eukprot:CAMPEP_0170355278 /NCGR_PEP_ID=MMETSP0117_2-20130122/559_1 /TAXON_ID=400756 /ORGANISM="Durinskia baltica, Strain CSIRO CS-38" /LENGTH=77 /DNA_ID=CAMNT_0010609309 /DNA_START=225 /DNA_END=458 /DNA_ORIENTATION=+